MVSPKIAVILDCEESGEYSEYPFYALRKNYFDSIKRAGGIALGVPYDKGNLKFYTDQFDGLVIPGGHFDIPPEYYTKQKQHSSVKLKPGRSEFEFAMLEGFLSKDKPILGICGGMQLIAVGLGGTLYQDIATEVEGSLEHEVKDRESVAHEIEILQGSLLHEIIGESKMGVNSSHHQAVRDIGDNLVACAHSSDGIIEAIEASNHNFCLGLQWHPEYLSQDNELKIFEEFINQC